MSTSTRDFLVFNDDKLAAKYGDEALPMSVLYESYFDGDIDITGDLLEVLRHRHEFLKFNITRQNLQWAVTNFVPDMVHTRQQDERLVRETYDRGLDMFQWLTGNTLCLSAGRFSSPDASLEQAQQTQFEHIGRVLDLSSGDRFLDLGCGWGALGEHIITHFGADTTLSTLSEEQAAYAERRIGAAVSDGKARVLRTSYRELAPEVPFDKISCVEMVQHVGLKNLSAFCERVHDILADDGKLLLQWTGIRRTLRQEELIWGLFVSKYIFPGADASLPPASMCKALEKAGFELMELTNVSAHYIHTLQAFRKNWLHHREVILSTYGERWFRIWNLYLSWSILVAEAGGASCYQAVLCKNAASLDRTRWL